MEDMIFRPIIEDMVWSYSRIKIFEDCPYRFYLEYINKYKGSERFYATYGKFIHKIIEEFYKGKLKKEDMLIRFLTGFKEEVRGRRPPNSTLEKFIELGSEYLKSFEPFPFKMIDVEKRITFELEGRKFVGFVDYIGEKDNDIYIVDNKSRELKPKSNRKKPTNNDLEIDTMLRQLYLYSIGIEQEYGKLPKYLCFNCFKNKVFIKEQFDIQKYEEAKRWAIGIINKILDEQDYKPNQTFFGCQYICDMSEHCKYDIESRAKWRE